MRLFIAIPFSDEFSGRMKQLQKALPEAKAKTNNHFHLTLQFLGEAGYEDLKKIKEALKEIHFKSFTLKLKKLGVFKNNKGHIKVVWAGFNFPDELKDLQKNIEDKMRKAGFVLDKPFSPHVTLVRIKFADDKKYEKELNEIKPEPLSEKVDKFVLYKSELRPDGPEYEEILTVNAKK
jgi:2'-5' RNA ligase